jgi:hypothetical protein
MRYKKTQITRQVVINEEIEDVDSVKKLLDNICESYIDISLEYLSINSDIPTLWKRVRVDSVTDDSANIKIFSGKCITKTTIIINRIKFIGIVTDRSGILSRSSRVTAYDFLDLSTDNEIK